MTTGTTGNDNLSNDPNLQRDTVTALAGDDIVTIIQPNNVQSFDFSRGVDVNGGDGFDTLILNAGLNRLTVNVGSIFVRLGLNTIYDVTYTEIERIELTGRFNEGGITLGNTIDILNVSSGHTNGNTVSPISTGGGNDEIYVTGVLRAAVDGGAGDDIIYLNQESITGQNGSTARGGAGNDQIHGLTFNPNAASEQLFGDGGSDQIWGRGGSDVIYGDDAGADPNFADFGDDFLYGEDGNDSLFGEGGDDTLDGGVGADGMSGGAGNDVYHVDDVLDSVAEQDGNGEDTVVTALGDKSDPSLLYVLPAFVENLEGTSEAAQGVRGNALDNLITMGAGNDLVVLDDGGEDTVVAGGGHDFLYYGGAFSETDLNDGGAGTDTVALLGTYNLTFGLGSLIDVERLALYTGIQNNVGTANSYTLTTVDANVAAGSTLTVLASSLAATETLVFNGSAETDGRFNITSGNGGDILAGGAKADALRGGGGADQLYGLGGNDTLVGGLGGDVLRGGFGRDTFRYESVAESTASVPDRIVDFGAGGEADRIDLSAIDANADTAENDAFTYIGSNGFSGAAGELRAVLTGGTWFIEGDTDGDQAADLFIRSDNSNHIFTAGDFVL